MLPRTNGGTLEIYYRDETTEGNGITAYHPFTGVLATELPPKSHTADMSPSESEQVQLLLL